MNDEIRSRLEELAEPAHQKFQQSLLPGVGNILGVRLPKLRKMAAGLAKSDWKTYLQNASDESFEETMLQGMTLGYVRAGLHEILPFVSAFVPKIGNWAVCDSFCAGLKLPRKYPQPMWDYLVSYLRDEREYAVRFAVVMLLTYYIDEAHIEQTFRLLDDVSHPGYYARMAVAWAVSVGYARFPQRTLSYLRRCSLCGETYGKALQKILESRQIGEEDKKIIRSMKRIRPQKL